MALDHADPDVQRSGVASLVADHLSRTLHDGSIVAVGMGRNVGAVADNVFEQGERKCSFVCAIGGSLRAGEYMNPDHICRRLAMKFGGDSETLYAPAWCRTPSCAMPCTRIPPCGRRWIVRGGPTLLIGVGDLSEDSNMVRMGGSRPRKLPRPTVGTVGDMMGYDFIDLHGQPARTPMQGRVIGLTIGDLARIPDVVAIASENTKPPVSSGRCEPA